MPSNIPGCVTHLCQLDPARDSFSDDFKIIAKRTAWQNFIGRLIHFITLGFRERNPQLDSAVLKAVSCAEEILKKGVKLPLKEKLERAFSNLLKVMEANDGHDKNKIEGLIEKIKQISPIEASAIRDAPAKDPQPKHASKPPEKQPTAKIVNPASPGLPPKASPPKPPAGTAVKPAAAPPSPKPPAVNPSALPAPAAKAVPAAAATSPPAVNPATPAPALVVEILGFSEKKDMPAVAAPVLNPGDLEKIEWLNESKKPLKELGSQRDQLLETHGKFLEYFETSDTADNLLEMLQRCPNIKQLVLVNCNIGKDMAVKLAGIPQMAGLTVLNLENNRIGPEGALAIAKAKCPNLTHLNLAFNKIGKGVDGIAQAENMPKLEILSLSNNEINNNGAIALGSSDHRKNLKILDLKINKISNEGVKALVLLQELIELDLSDNNIRDAGATAIAQAKLAHLRKLSLLNNKIKPSFMQAIKDSKSLPSGVKIIFEE